MQQLAVNQKALIGKRTGLDGLLAHQRLALPKLAGKKLVLVGGDGLQRRLVSLEQSALEGLVDLYLMVSHLQLPAQKKTGKGVAAGA